MRKKIHLIFSICILFVSSEVFAQDNVVPVQNPNQLFKTPDYTGEFSERSTLLGDLGGERQKLANDGITLDMKLAQVTQGVVSGGRNRDWSYMGRGETTLNLDTAKMGLWPGGLLTVIGEGNFGTSLAKDIGAALDANVNSLLPQTENDFVIPQVAYTQFFSPEFGIAVGKFATITDESGDINEFAHGKGYDKFMNINFNFNPIMTVVVPYSTLGANVIYLPSKDLAITAGVIDPHGSPESSGFSDFFGNGATFVTQGRLATDFFGLAGHQLAGVAYSTSEYTDLDQRAANLIIPGLPIQEASDSWAVFWNMDQYVYRPDAGSDRGIGLFARFGISDGDANPIGETASFGASAKGMLFGREQDRVGIGYFYLWSADTEITKRTGFEDSQGMEAFYEIAITPALRLTPDIQWLQPSQQRVDQSWILGLRLSTAL